MCRTFEGANTTVIQGDAVEVLDRDVADGSVDLIFAYPPENIGERFSLFVDKWRPMSSTPSGARVGLRSAFAIRLG